jgi:osmotically-inducible protein OsmY
MSEYREKRTIVQGGPVGHPIIETRSGSVVHERPGMSGRVIGSLVVAAIAAAIVITMLIINSQQRYNDQELAQERARITAGQQTPAQPTQQLPIMVNVPSSQPATAPAAVPAPIQLAPTAAAPSSADVEMEVKSKLLDDQELRSHSVDVRVSGGTATLSGHVPYESLKTRAEKLAGTVKGVLSVVNNIAVQS